MKFGPVLTYKDVDEAKRLIGKMVLVSDVLCDIESVAPMVRPEILRTIHDHEAYPFEARVTCYQFIREILPDKPEYEPYDLSDPKVRDSLRGRWFAFKDDRDVERAIEAFYVCNGVWTANGNAAEYLLRHCTWLDGTPCGRKVE